MIFPGLVRSESSSVSHRKYASAVLAPSSFSPAGIAAPRDRASTPTTSYSPTTYGRNLASASSPQQASWANSSQSTSVWKTRCRDTVEPADLDLVTGRLNPDRLEGRFRQVFLIRDRGTTEPPGDDEEPPEIRSGEFKPCGVCGKRAGFNRSYVQDHQTKGDEPFQALVTRQVAVQSPGQQARSDFAPLRGRKVLAFSDSRQVAARLAPNLQMYSMRDVLRPLLLAGMNTLDGVPGLSNRLTLDDLYLAVLIGARTLHVRLRPQLLAGESMQAQRDVDAVIDVVSSMDPDTMLDLFMSVRTSVPPTVAPE